jgi:hypothetical protein
MDIPVMLIEKSATMYDKYALIAKIGSIMTRIKLLSSPSVCCVDFGGIDNDLKVDPELISAPHEIQVILVASISIPHFEQCGIFTPSNVVLRGRGARVGGTRGPSRTRC